MSSSPARLWTLALLLLLPACSEYGFNDEGREAGGGVGPGPGDGGSGGGAGDGGSDDGDTGSTVVPGDEDDCKTTMHVRIGLAVDDWFEAWVDGTRLGEAESWWASTWYEMDLECGQHVIAVHGVDYYQAISGFISVVEIDGQVAYLSGDGSGWRGTLTPPTGNAWKVPGFDDSSWTDEEPCQEASALGWWGNNPSDLRALGAWWIWSQPCEQLGESWFRIAIDVE
jgi:hypothetical protein